MLLMGLLYLLGDKVVSRLSLRDMSEEERASRMAKFRSTLLSRALLVLYVVYPGARAAARPVACLWHATCFARVPAHSWCGMMSTRSADTPARLHVAGVSVAVFSMARRLACTRGAVPPLTAHRPGAAQFSCTKFKSGAAYLDADFNITCYDRQHWKYLGAAVVWLFVVPIGVPAFFIWLLRHFKVPQMAKMVNDSAWLREAVQLAWQLDMTQPPMCVGKLNVDNIGDAHLEGLYALFVRNAPVATASNIVTGASPPLPEQEAATAPVPTGAVAKALASVRAAVAAVSAALERIKFAAYQLVNPDAAGAVGETAEAQRRAFVLKALLTWCQTSGKLALPTMAWEEMVEEAEEEPQAKEAAKPRISTTTRGTPLKCADLPRLQARSMSEVGFLFAAYHTSTWYWCVSAAVCRRCV
jgi:hypothetical protein